MSHRELIRWYVLYALIIAGTEVVLWWLLFQNRFLDGVGVLLMLVGVLWVSIDQPQ